MPPVSVGDIRDADLLVAEFCSPTNGYAWPLYDEDPSPRTLCGADLTAPALASYPIQGKYLNEMGRGGSEYAELVSLMREFVTLSPTSRFAELDPGLLTDAITRTLGGPVSGPADWQALIRCLDAVNGLKGMTSVAVTKILHRKRPDLVPIVDSRLTNFYGGKTRRYDLLFQAIHNDLQNTATQKLLAEISQHRSTPAGRPMTDLRALDIVVWMYMGR